MSQPPAPRPVASTPRFAPLPLPDPWWDRIPAVTLTLGLVLAVLLALGLVVPVPYAVRMPGPTVDTLGEVDDEPLISISDAETYPSDGQLRLTTVSASGGPDYPVFMLRALQGFFDPASSVLPREAIFPENQTAEEAKEQSQAQMTSSQENATAAALTALGYEVPADLVVAGVVEDGPAVGAIEVDDVIESVEIDGVVTETATFPDLLGLLDRTPPGTPITLALDRAGTRASAELTTGDDGAGGSVIGVLIDPDFHFPVNVAIQIHDIGGPSAGTMFALGIMELLTPGDATGGHVIAGTGTIDLEGNVGPIGGIVQKMNGSLRDGAEFFLAPVANCGDVAGHVPGDLRVVAVGTLEEAWAAVQAIGTGDAADLPSC
ncbi:YlbL family protein [Salana multivorans]|uniref:YlbL family protein n=1 Tax=Salana multivorans TaxID=120377 RepID=UPI000B0FAED4|nr:S16 family serine protease [Salana multivorans]